MAGGEVIFPRRIDANQPEIVEAFRQLGCEVAITSNLGHGFPDLIVGKPKRQKVVLVEVKDGSKPPSARKLTPDEQKFRDAWAGSYAVVETIPDVVNVVSLYL
jgi:hypothetical protein